MPRDIPKECISHLTCTGCTYSVSLRSTATDGACLWFGTSAECNLDIASDPRGTARSLVKWEWESVQWKRDSRSEGRMNKDTDKNGRGNGIKINTGERVVVTSYTDVTQ